MKLLALALLVAPAPPVAQDTLRLPELQRAAVSHDPRLRRLALEEAATDLQLRNIAVERLPGFSVTGQATHQSEVAAIPLALPGVDVAAPPSDRYEVALQSDWLLLDGGALSARREAERARLATARAELAAELHPLRMEVTDAFFGALVLQERVRETSALMEDLEASLSEVRDHVRAGSALPGDTAAVRAELLRSEQRRSELAADRRASLRVLAELTGRGIPGGATLALPELAEAVARTRATAGAATLSPPEPGGIRVHPQFATFDARREGLEREAEVIRARSRPQVSAFGQYAYGRPGLRQFTDDVHAYWLAGLRARWVPWDRGAGGREVEVVRIRQQILDAEEAAFARRLTRQVQRPLEAMDRLRDALGLDEQIIALREQIERQARVQLEERAITAAAYVDARTDLQEARIARLRHRAELARARAEYLTILGVELP